MARPICRRPFNPVRQERHDAADAFIPEPEDGPARTDEALAEARAEQFLEAATTGEDPAEATLDATVEEELGGPFIETTAEEEFASGTDESNPPDAKREPFPLPISRLIDDPVFEEAVEDLDELDELDKKR